MAAWMQEVYSSNIREVGYDPDAQELLVVFRKSGKKAAYPNVTEDAALQLANAPSVGTMFNAEFKHLPFRYV